MKEGRAADESIGSGMRALGCSLEINTAVYADVVTETPLLPPGPAHTTRSSAMMKTCAIAYFSIAKPAPERLL